LSWTVTHGETSRCTQRGCQLDHLLEDARFLLATDPARLVPTSTPHDPPGRATARVYRQCAHSSPPRLANAASQLELTATT